MTTHTPAWKRLGLKLKNESSVTAPADKSVKPQINGSSPESPGRNGHDQQDRPPKRRKIGENFATNFVDQSSKLNKDSEVMTETGSGSPVLSQRKRKSVSFAAQTEQSNGHSRTTTDFPAKSHNSPLDHSEDDGASTTNGHTDIMPEVETNVKKAPKRPKVKGASKKARSGPDLKNQQVVDYLEQHYKDRTSWKFNKNRDSWILAHALDPRSISSEHDEALKGYIAGLPENAGARSRLSTQATEALAGHGNETELDGDQQVRAKLLLDALGLDPAHVVSVSKRMDNGQPVLPRKKKSRTTAPVDMSSSSDSSTSESDSDSESGSEPGSSQTSSSSTSSPSSNSEDSDGE